MISSNSRCVSSVRAMRKRPTVTVTFTPVRESGASYVVPGISTISGDWAALSAAASPTISNAIGVAHTSA
jgi:hypothetical protein